MISIRVNGQPAPQGSKKGYVRGGKVVMVESSAAVKPWREAVKAAAMAQHPRHPMITGPCIVTVEFRFLRPKGHYGAGRNAERLKASAPICHVTTPDIDKLVRSTLDALADAGTFRNDSQVFRVEVEKTYAEPDETAGAVITVTEARGA